MHQISVIGTKSWKHSAQVACYHILRLLHHALKVALFASTCQMQFRSHTKSTGIRYTIELSTYRKQIRNTTPDNNKARNGAAKPRAFDLMAGPCI